jgi:3-oxoacyl-[acyl-carrier-protein] synthase III
LDDYRKGDFEDCVAKERARKRLEGLMSEERATLNTNKDTAAPLLEKVLAKSALDTGTFKESLLVVARIRNRLSSSHGGGSSVKKVERHVAQYAVTSTAAAIVLLVQDMGK